MSLFDELFGGIETANNMNTVSFEEKKPAKKEAEKKESKDAEKKGEKKGERKPKSKKVNDPTVTLPVTILARGWKMRVDGSGEKKLSEVLKGLIEQGYRELALSKIGAVYCAKESGDNLVYVTLTGGISMNSTPDDTIVSFESDITIMDGELQMQVTPDLFEGLDADEITAGKLRDLWVRQNPSYKGCSLLVEGDVAYPLLETTIGNGDKVPDTLIVNGERIAIEDDLTAGDAIKKYYGEDTSVKAHICKMGDEDACLVYTGYSSEVKKGVDALKKNEKKAEQKFKLPLQVLFTTIGRNFDLKPEDFGGSQKITMEELKKYLANSYTVFSDDKKIIESVYVEEENMLSLAIVSGRKG